MSTLVLHLESADDNKLAITPAFRQAGRPEVIWGTVCCDADQVRTVSREMHRVLADAFQAAFNVRGELDLAGARGHLEKLRTLGEQLCKLLFTDAAIRQLEASASIQHVLLECTPQWNTLPLELVFLDDFFCFRYGIGRQLHTTGRAVLPERPPADRGFQAFSVVDPGRLLADAGSDLGPGFRGFQDRWESLVHANGTPLRQRIDFDAARVFRSTSPQQMADAVRHHPLVTFIGHHHFDPQNPQHSGFVLGPGDGDPEIVFTAEDLQRCLGAGQAPPRVLLSIACRSGLTEGWQTQWIDDDRVFGMVDASIRCGIPHYIGTVVKIPAERSPDVMLPFYEQLARGQTIGRALWQARRALRRVADDSLDGGTLLGLTLVLYGNPATGYFCADGHRCDTAATMTCGVVTDSGICGNLVCDRDPDFARGRCVLHAAAPVPCAAGHAVAESSQLAACTVEGCRNTVCPACRGWGQGLCWEHCCYDGHPIVVAGSATVCRDPDRRHSGEKRSVCPLDWEAQRGLCSECLTAVLQEQQQLRCSHCGLDVDESNSWAGHCSCGRRLCDACWPWYQQTFYCLDLQRNVADKDAEWLGHIERRAEQDKDLARSSLLAIARMNALGFEGGVATNLADFVARRPRLPRLRADARMRILPEPRLRTVTQAAGDLGNSLAGTFERAWNLPADPARPHDAWTPPAPWRSSFRNANRLQIHLLRTRTDPCAMIAVATVTPVEFVAGRGPVLVPCNTGHVDILAGICKDWWRGNHRAGLPDVYLVLHTVTGFRGNVNDQPGWFTVVAETRDDGWHITAPSVEGHPQQVRDFVRILTPETSCRRWQRYRDWIENRLEEDEVLTALKAQAGIQAEWDEPVQLDDVLGVIGRMQESSRYVPLRLEDGQTAIRRATRAERARR